MRGEAPVRIVGPQAQPELRAGGEHPVRLGHPAQGQIVDQHPDIGLGPVEPDGGAPPASRAAFTPGDQPLGGGFLIPGGAVDLPGQEQARHRAHLQRRGQGAGVHIIVLHRIARAQHLRPLQPRDGPQHRPLHLLRQAGGDAVGIHRRVVQPLGLQEDLVPRPIREPGHLVLDRRAVARPRPGNRPAIHRGAVQVRPDQRVGRLGGRRHPAGDLRRGDPRRQRAERLRRIVPRVGGQALPGDAVAVQPRRGAGLEPPGRQPQPRQGPRQAERRRFPDPSRRGLVRAHMHHAAQERARGQHHGGAGQPCPVGGDHGGEAAVGADLQILHRRLADLQARGCRPAGPGSRRGTAPGRPARAGRGRRGPCCG